MNRAIASLAVGALTLAIWGAPAVVSHAATPSVAIAWDSASSVAEGKKFKFASSATDITSTKYAWQIKPKGAAEFKALKDGDPGVNYVKKSVGLEYDTVRADDQAAFRLCYTDENVCSNELVGTVTNTDGAPQISGVENQSALVGENATFDANIVRTVDADIRVAWQKKVGKVFLDMEGASFTTGSSGTYSYSTLPVNSADDGTMYRVRVCTTPDPANPTTEVCMNSKEATLSVRWINLKATTVGNPTVAVEDTVAISSQVFSSSSKNNTYQVQKSLDGTLWSDVAGASGTVANEAFATYTFKAQASDNGTSYRFMATNAKGDKAYSEPVKLTVLQAAMIETQPADTTLAVGDKAKFFVKASDAAGYQWQKSADNGATWSDISGANEVTYETEAAAQADDGTLFRVIIKGTNGATTNSNAAKLTVAKKPGLSITVDNMAVVQGDTVTGSATGFLPNAKVTGVVHSTPMDLPEMTADDSGKVTFSFSTATLDLGNHTVTLASSDGQSVSGAFSVNAPSNPNEEPNTTPSENPTESAKKLPQTGSGIPVELAFISLFAVLLGGAALFKRVRVQ